MRFAENRRFGSLCQPSFSLEALGAESDVVRSGRGVQRPDRLPMNSLQNVADTDFAMASVCSCALRWRFSFSSPAFVWHRQPRNHQPLIPWSWICWWSMTKARPFPRRGSKSALREQLLATAIDRYVLGEQSLTLGNNGTSLQLTVSKQGYLVTSTALETKGKTPRLRKSKLF